MAVEHNEFRSSVRAGSQIDAGIDSHRQATIATLAGRPLLANTGMPLNLDWVREVRINTSAVERRAQARLRAGR